MSTLAKTCPHCGRHPGACWVMPCLGLSAALEDGADAVNAWLELVEAPFRVQATTEAKSWADTVGAFN